MTPGSAPGSATAPVSVSGDFNGWKADVDPMTRSPDGTYTATVAVTPGVHHYKIVDDGKWIENPVGDKAFAFDDGFGGKNSGFSATPAGDPPAGSRHTGAVRSQTPAGALTHTFRYVPPAGSPTVPVSVAADFNGWSAAPDPLTRSPDGVYQGTFVVPAGLHHYKIVYDGKWIADPENRDHSLEEPDPNGGQNSGFIAGPGNIKNDLPVADSPAAAPAATPAGMVMHTFRFVPPAGTPTVPVSVAGDFNSWSAAPNPMTRDADGSYSVTVPVPPGVHHYKIVDDGKWIADPTNDDHALENPDPNGGKNSGFIAKPAGG